jgi:predicted DNA-binding transcriptional regulator AlpA
MGDNENELLTERDAADWLKLTSKCLQAWRQQGRGPAFVRIGSRTVRYRVTDLREWVGTHVRRSTSDPGSAA